MREIQCCHANQDAGFLVTYSHVRDTLADRCYRTVFECLSGDPSKTFNVAEASSFRSLPLCLSASLSLCLSLSLSLGLTLSLTVVCGRLIFSAIGMTARTPQCSPE